MLYAQYLTKEQMEVIAEALDIAILRLTNYQLGINPDERGTTRKMLVRLEQDISKMVSLRRHFRAQTEGAKAPAHNKTTSKEPTA